MRGRARRSTVVFVEAVLAVAATGIAVGTPVGYTVAGVAAVAGIAGVVRRRGRGLVDVAADRLGDAAGTDLLSGLHVVDVPTRDGPGLGVAGDGQGFVVVLDAGAPGSWALADVLDLAFADPARPAGVQVLVEQHGSVGVDERFGPARTYRSLPVSGLPLWTRVLLAVRHEPAWAPETVESRGGGATGAHNALAAVAARATAATARDGIALRALGADELTGLLRDLGPAPDGDVVLGVPLTGDDAPGGLLRELAALDVARAVLSVSASAVDHTLCALVRITDLRDGVAGQAAERLVADGLATPLPPGAQDEGVVATLPLGGGARSLTHVVAQVRR